MTDSMTSKSFDPRLKKQLNDRRDEVRPKAVKQKRKKRKKAKPIIYTEIGKICTYCDEDKPLDQYSKNRSYCKSCDSILNRTYRENNVGSIAVKRMHSRDIGDVEEPEWTAAEIDAKIGTRCERSGIIMNGELAVGGKNANPFKISPDRIDNTKGYTKENTQFVVWIYNQMKGNFTQEEADIFVKALVEHEINNRHRDGRVESNEDLDYCDQGDLFE